MRDKVKKVVLSKNEEECFLCGRRPSEHHHVFEGTSNRKNSDRYGLIVPLCYECHRGNNGVHFNRDRAIQLKQYAQSCFEEVYSHEEFMQIFGKNYL